jgi:aerobic C4-dicarboxylate transport protein
MSECRSLTNFIGNAVATVVVSRWENALDTERLDAALNGHALPVAAVVAAPVVTADVPVGAATRTVA